MRLQPRGLLYPKHRSRPRASCVQTQLYLCSSYVVFRQYGSKFFCIFFGVFLPVFLGKAQKELRVEIFVLAFTGTIYELVEFKLYFPEEETENFLLNKKIVTFFQKFC
jgi:hypothetical protein